MTAAAIARELTRDYGLTPPLRAADVREVADNRGERWEWGIRRYGDEVAVGLESAILQAVDR